MIVVNRKSLTVLLRSLATDCATTVLDSQHCLVLHIRKDVSVYCLDVLEARLAIDLLSVTRGGIVGVLAEWLGLVTSEAVFVTFRQGHSRSLLVGLLRSQRYQLFAIASLLVVGTTKTFCKVLSGTAIKGAVSNKSHEIPLSLVIPLSLDIEKRTLLRR